MKWSLKLGSVRGIGIHVHATFPILRETYAWHPTHSPAYYDAMELIEQDAHCLANISGQGFEYSANLTRESFKLSRASVALRQQSRDFNCWHAVNRCWLAGYWH